MAGANSDHAKPILIKGKDKIIYNGGSAANRNARRLGLNAFEKALEAVDPFPCVKSSMKVTHEHLVVCNVRIPPRRFRDVFILAAGKASASMMHAALRTLEGISSRGILVTSKGEKAQTFDSRVETFRSGHPIPDRDPTLFHDAVQILRRHQLWEEARTASGVTCLVESAAGSQRHPNRGTRCFVRFTT